MQSEDQHLAIPSGEISLEAVLHRPGNLEPAGILVVCHPHPLYGGSMDNNVVQALCDAALQEGLAALRFNFRGVGTSGGTHDNGIGERDDVLAALTAAARAPGGQAIGLAGYSFGAGMAALAVAHAGLSLVALVLVSPPLSRLHDLVLGHGPTRRLLITGDRDHVAPAPQLEAIASRLVPQADCVVVDGADHSWLGHEAELRDTVGGFLRWHLARS